MEGETDRKGTMRTKEMTFLRGKTPRAAGTPEADTNSGPGRDCWRK